MRLPLTKCVSGTGIFAARPGSVLSAGSRDFIFFMKANMGGLSSANARIAP